jgi:hypothetical protein
VADAVRAEITEAERLRLAFRRRMEAQPLPVPFTLTDRTADAIGLAALTQGRRA